MLDHEKINTEIKAGGELAAAHPREDMHESELQHFHGLLTQGDQFGALTGAFMLGFERGHRIGRREAPATGSQADAYREMINEAAQECRDVALLDLVWRILIKCNEEAAV